MKLFLTGLLLFFLISSFVFALPLDSKKPLLPQMPDAETPELINRLEKLAQEYNRETLRQPGDTGKIRNLRHDINVLRGELDGRYRTGEKMDAVSATRFRRLANKYGWLISPPRTPPPPPTNPPPSPSSGPKGGGKPKPPTTRPKGGPKGGRGATPLDACIIIGTKKAEDEAHRRIEVQKKNLEALRKKLNQTTNLQQREKIIKKITQTQTDIESRENILERFEKGQYLQVLVYKCTEMLSGIKE